MNRTAVFVDAGYLFAQGSVALTGSKKARTALILDASKAIAALKSIVEQKAPSSSLLRIYWYDGAVGGVRPTTDQAALANLDDVKLRLGFINSHGQQKGVDSLIVTDLIELARLKSISDAVLLSGDEDVRVGVQIAQNYGVRLHLIGIAPSRGSQSPQLLQEADTTSEWSPDMISNFLSLREDQSAQIIDIVDVVVTDNPQILGEQQILEKIEAAVATFVASLAAADVQGIVAYWETARGVPTELDRKILPICGTALGRNLDRTEIRHMRSCFQTTVKKRVDG
ncbi:MAG: NYN domain-containing protein [Rhizobiaceae bacterium]|nr:NYN domain-containing protein [Rhizobiaceae bacterium]